jgi:hypothetical protein
LGLAIVDIFTGKSVAGAGVRNASCRYKKQDFVNLAGAVQVCCTAQLQRISSSHMSWHRSGYLMEILDIRRTALSLAHQIPHVQWLVHFMLLFDNLMDFLFDVFEVVFYLEQSLFQMHLQNLPSPILPFP